MRYTPKPGEGPWCSGPAPAVTVTAVGRLWHVEAARVSLGWYSTEAEAQARAESIREAQTDIRAIVPDG